MWYFITFALPATIKLASMSVGAIASHGVVSPLGAAGLLALAITATTTVFILRGLHRTITRLARTIAAR
jgi:hypothetical protein